MKAVSLEQLIPRILSKNAAYRTSNPKNTFPFAGINDSALNHLLSSVPKLTRQWTEVWPKRIVRAQSMFARLNSEKAKKILVTVKMLKREEGYFGQIGLSGIDVNATDSQRIHD